MTREPGAPFALGAITAVALLVAAGAATYLVAAPATSTQQVARDAAGRKGGVTRRIATDREAAAALEAAARRRVWQGGVDRATAKLTALLSREAARNGANLTGFRAQRARELGALLELPFFAQVTGSYEDVRRIAAALDASGSRIAVRSVQFAASDGDTDAVTASLGLSVFLWASDQEVSRAAD